MALEYSTHWHLSIVADIDLLQLTKPYLQERAEGPMEHSAQGKRSDTLGSTCWSSRAMKGQKH